jgi:G3E family GTPase
MDEIKKSEVIIVTGFLGSGKTTLVESIIKAPFLANKIAVI